MDKKKESHVKPYYDTWQIVLPQLPFNYKQGLLLLNLRLPVRDLAGGPVAKTLHSQCKGPGLNPWSGNWIPCAATKDSIFCNKDRKRPRGSSPVLKHPSEKPSSDVRSRQWWLFHPFLSGGFSSHSRILNHSMVGIPWWSSDLDSMLPLQGTWVQSLVRELDPMCHDEERVCLN